MIIFVPVAGQRLEEGAGSGGTDGNPARAERSSHLAEKLTAS